MKLYYLNKAGRSDWLGETAEIEKGVLGYVTEIEPMCTYQLAKRQVKQKKKKENVTCSGVFTFLVMLPKHGEQHIHL